jgi:ascorbate-specific PTS system EIIC-type component UlaA
MNIIIYFRDVIVSLLLTLGLSHSLTVGMADVSLVAIVLGLLIAAPEIVLLLLLILIAMAYLGNR